MFVTASELTQKLQVMIISFNQLLILGYISYFLKIVTNSRYLLFYFSSPSLFILKAPRIDVYPISILKSPSCLTNKCDEVKTEESKRFFRDKLSDFDAEVSFWEGLIEKPRWIELPDL